MEETAKTIEKTAQKEIDSANTLDELDQLKIKYLGRKGTVSKLIKELANLPAEKRPSAGEAINRLKSILNQEFKQRREEILTKQTIQPTELLDVTMPGVRFGIGNLHPINKTIDEVCAIFSHMGFAIVEGPEIETEYNNFEALNIPTDHPSRDIFDTFYINPAPVHRGWVNPVRNIVSEGGSEISNGVNSASGGRDWVNSAFAGGPGAEDKWLLRSHTSPVQIRYMQSHTPPFSIVVPGKVFRPDAVDASHSFMFHQIEGLMVSDNISFANLKWVLFEFARQYFGSASRVRFRPHFFPFTEPSAEVDVSCIICGGEGCRVCSNKGWLEILGAGLVDPNVFKVVGIDPEKFSGFAFGMGVERIAMLKYSIDDIRLFFENDLRFLRQF